MIGALTLRHRRKTGRSRDSDHQSGTSDHESERVGTARRKRRKRECRHDPWAQDLAQVIMGAYYWITEPTSLKPELGNGLESTAWGQFCMNEKSILIGMLVFRLFNYLIVQTYYVPDEYWQSIEVAHNQAFGDGYLTWEWSAKIRSYLYPGIFTFLYKILDLLGLDSFNTVTRIPRLMQTCLSAVGDLYLYKLSSKLSGHHVAQWTLLCQCLSWFTFYCATRTLTNTAESVLITIGLFYYPWTKAAALSSGVWKFLWIAAISVFIRPTAAIIWLPLCLAHIMAMRKQLKKTIVLYCGTALVFGCLSVRIDKAFYGEWTFVPLNFFYFNVTKKISHIYGTHPWHWYLTQGLPFVLSTHYIILILGWKKCKSRSLQIAAFFTLCVYSVLPHKEFRFVLPLLPLTMHICGYYITTIHQQSQLYENQSKSRLESITEEQIRNQIEEVKRDESKTHSAKSQEADSGLTTTSEFSDSFSDTEVMENVRRRVAKRYQETHPKAPLLTTRRVLWLLVLGNLPMMFYFSVVHQRGALDVVKFLHTESLDSEDMSVLYLMPCHSTPYYSHIHRNITMRFLTCEPNLDEIPEYQDEAQMFYEDPIKWLKAEVVKGPNKHVYSHVVMFDSLELKVEKFLTKGKYRRCGKFFYTHLLDDERRSKHILVYCRSKQQ